jgi:hypothetical protein
MPGKQGPPAEIYEERKVEELEKGKEDMEPIDQPVLFIVHKNVLVVKGEDDEIDKPLVKETLGQHHKKEAGQ